MRTGCWLAFRTKRKPRRISNNRSAMKSVAMAGALRRSGNGSTSWSPGKRNILYGNETILGHCFPGLVKLGVPTSSRLTKLAGLYIERFLSKKRALNAVDFDDLLLGTRNLLREHNDIRRHYQDHLEALLVDEFQDTDEVQSEIISLLAADPHHPGRLAPAKLMIVGDPKQSIYRFRRARVTVFFRLLQRILDEGGRLEHLQENYRSAAPIAEFSNRLSELMMDGAGKIEDIAHAQADLSYRIRFSEADVLKPKSDAPFLGITYVAAESGAKAAQGREMEAEAI